jgi:MFS family permease
VVTGLCSVILPVSQAIIGDLTRASGNSAVHSFGIISATFGLGLCIGPLLGGFLTSVHRGAACFTAAGEYYNLKRFARNTLVYNSTAAQSAAAVVVVALPQWKHQLELYTVLLHRYAGCVLLPVHGQHSSKRW